MDDRIICPVYFKMVDWKKIGTHIITEGDEKHRTQIVKEEETKHGKKCRVDLYKEYQEDVKGGA
jgi:hypothetical protein